MSEQKKKSAPRGVPRKAGKKAKKMGGVYYKVIMARAIERKKARNAKRQLRFAMRRLAKKEAQP